MPAGLVIPELGGLAAAVMLLLIAGALWILGQLLAKTLSQAPVIGPWIATHVVAYIFDASDAVVHAAKASWRFAERMFLWAERWIVHLWDSAVTFAENTAVTIGHIVTVQIPAVIRGTEAYALTLAGQAVTAAGQLVTAARRDLSASIAAARQAADTGIAAAERDAAAAVSDLRAGTQAAMVILAAETSSAVAAAERLAAEGIGAAESTAAAGLAAAAAAVQADLTAVWQALDAGVSRAETQAAAQLAAVRAGIYTDLETWGNQAVAAAWPGAGGEIDALRRAAGADFPWLNDLAGALGGLGAAGLAGTLIRAMATSQALTRLATDCVLPSCRNLSGLSQLLHDLEDLIGGGLLFALLAEMVAHPVRSAHDIDAQISTLVDDTIKGFASLLGA